jgi:hypothetical protein
MYHLAVHGTVQQGIANIYNGPPQKILQHNSHSTFVEEDMDDSERSLLQAISLFQAFVAGNRLLEEG